ncbi:MAG TPA: single-stranded DNA-binding protein [Solirubrobacterales bacterium]|jgi:single-strand DNA-binding protein|nr:single-stranded DNA-binding protein [Solirubrobacterales bacterium]
MNNVSLTGRLTRDPELRDTRAGAVCQLRLAVDNPGRGGQKGEPTYVDVASFGAQAEACARHLAKGRQVAVSGRLVFREWTGKDGARRSAHSMRGRVDFLG